jgi:hypothetical protein
MTEKSEVLTGARAIAQYLNWPARRVYHAARSKTLPLGHHGGLLVAFKSELDQAIKDKIQKSMSGSQP